MLFSVRLSVKNESHACMGRNVCGNNTMGCRLTVFRCISLDLSLFNLCVKKMQICRESNI